MDICCTQISRGVYYDYASLSPLTFLSATSLSLQIFSLSKASMLGVVCVSITWLHEAMSLSTDELLRITSLFNECWLRTTSFRFNDCWLRTTSLLTIGWSWLLGTTSFFSDSLLRTTSLSNDWLLRAPSIFTAEDPLPRTFSLSKGWLLEAVHFFTDRPFSTVSNPCELKEISLLPTKSLHVVGIVPTKNWLLGMTCSSTSAWDLERVCLFLIASWLGIAPLASNDSLLGNVFVSKVWLFPVALPYISVWELDIVSSFSIASPSGTSPLFPTDCLLGIALFSSDLLSWINSSSASSWEFKAVSSSTNTWELGKVPVTSNSWLFCSFFTFVSFARFFFWILKSIRHQTRGQSDGVTTQIIVFDTWGDNWSRMMKEGREAGISKQFPRGANEEKSVYTFRRISWKLMLLLQVKK